MLMVSYCDQCMSIVGHQQFLKWHLLLHPCAICLETSIWTEVLGWPVDQKIAKIVPVENPRWQPSWKSILNFSWTKRPIDLGSIGLAWNMVGSIRLKIQTGNPRWLSWVTGRSKSAKIILIGNPRWLPWPLSWKSILNFFSWNWKANWLEL